MKVVFIVGANRSGSTLLDALLGQIDGFCSTGELNNIWESGFKLNSLCSCKKHFDECIFWSRVKDMLGLDDKQIDDILAMINTWNKPLGLSIIALISRYKDHDRFYGYARIVKEIYDAIKEVSRCNVIIDSSKLIYHGFLLKHIEGIELYVIHLIRDSRAVAYSYKRKKIENLDSYRVSYMWMVRNMLAEKLFKNLGDRYIAIRYEDLAYNPKAILIEILDRIDEDKQVDFINKDRAYIKKDVHIIGGNPSKYDMNGYIDIKPDVEWRYKLDKKDRLVATLLTYPLLKRYGYE